MGIRDLLKSLTTEGYGVTIGSRVVAFLGVRGGVGTTTYALNTACALAKAGKQVLYIDGNLELPNAYRFLLSNPDEFQSELRDALLGSEISLDTIMVETKFKNIRLISSNPVSKLGDYMNIRMDACERLLELAGRRFDVIVIDCNSSLYLELTLASIKCANNIFVVTEPDKELYLGLAKLRDYLAVMMHENKLKNVIQNKVTLRAFSEADLKDIGLHSFAEIPYAPELMQSNVADEVLVSTGMYENLGYEFEKVIDRICGVVGGVR